MLIRRQDISHNEILVGLILSGLANQIFAIIDSSVKNRFTFQRARESTIATPGIKHMIARLNIIQKNVYILPNIWTRAGEKLGDFIVTFFIQGY